MKRKILSMILGTAIAASLLTGCGGSQEAAATTAAAAADTTAAAADSTAAADAATEAAKAATGEGKKVGVAMPTQSSERWINDGANMKKQLEALGYEVDLQYAEDDVQMQVSQIENMIASGVNCLVTGDDVLNCHQLSILSCNQRPVLANLVAGAFQSSLTAVCKTVKCACADV